MDPSARSWLMGWRRLGTETWWAEGKKNDFARVRKNLDDERSPAHGSTSLQLSRDTQGANTLIRN
jgi:hypothetical protein